MDAKMNHSDLSALLAKELNISIAKSEQFTKAFFDLIIEGLAEDGIVKINGLGTFKVADVASRSSVDVNTGAKIEIKGHKKLTFTPADSLKEEVNRPFAMFEPVEVDESYQDEVDNGENEDSEVAAAPVETIKADQPEAGQAVVPEVEAAQEECAVAEEKEEVCVPDAAPVVDDVQEQDAVVVAEEEPGDDTVIQEQDAVVVAEEVSGDDTVIGVACDESAVESAVETTVEDMQATEQPTAGETPSSAGDAPQAEAEEVVPVSENVSPEISSEDEEPARAVNFSWRGNAKWFAVIVVAVAAVLIILRRSADGQQPIVIEPATTVVAENENKSQEVADVAVPVALQDTAQAVEPVEEAPYVFEMVPELACRNLKTITMADTLHYVAVGDWTVHRVGGNETLVRIAKKYYGDKKLWPYLAMYNKLWNPDGLRRNMVIMIPKLKPRK